MRFVIHGADRDTAEDIELGIEAPDETSAREIAHRKGIMVSAIVPAAVPAPVTRVVARPQPSRMEQGHYEGAPVVNIAPPRRGNSLGVASLVLGILAFLICWIPLVNLLGVPLAALGLLLGAIGILVALTRRGASIGYPIAGSAICGLALFIAIGMTGALVGGIKGAGEAMARQAEQRVATNQIAAVPADETGWASAEGAVNQGDIQVQVTRVSVGKVPLKGIYGDGGSETVDVLLSIQIEISNLSETTKTDYRSWRENAIFSTGGATLTDNFGNEYSLLTFGLSDGPVGSVRFESVYPEASVKDVITFQAPIEKAEYLNLELPASNFGGEGVLRIRIPASMIQR